MEPKKRAEEDSSCMGFGLSEHGEIRSSTIQVTPSDAQCELGKFLKLADDLGPGLGMFSVFIDKLWNELIVDDKSYISFCSNSGVSAWKREVNKGQVPELIKWVTEYAHRWGMLPPVWFADEAGIVSANVYWSFLENREIHVVPQSFAGVNEE